MEEDTLPGVAGRRMGEEREEQEEEEEEREQEDDSTGKLGGLQGAILRLLARRIQVQFDIRVLGET